MSVKVISGYFDRRNYGQGVNAGMPALCMEHGDARWGDPFEGDGMVAFNARYGDTTGDWCWAPNVGAPCMECES